MADAIISYSSLVNRNSNTEDAFRKHTKLLYFLQCTQLNVVANQDRPDIVIYYSNI